MRKRLKNPTQSDALICYLVNGDNAVYLFIEINVKNDKKRSFKNTISSKDETSAIEPTLLKMLFQLTKASKFVFNYFEMTYRLTKLYLKVLFILFIMVSDYHIYTVNLPYLNSIPTIIFVC